jgi:hypothetical protein
LASVVDELFDLASPAHPGRVALKDLVACGQGAAFVTALVDPEGFSL